MQPTREWNAQAYHRVSEPQFRWGLKVLSRLQLSGTETVIDAGCGSGRLTAELLERLPHGRALAIDVSENMLEQAKATLLPRFAGRVEFQVADLAELRVAQKVDVIFSTATFHWVLDQDALYRSLAGCLRPGGLLHAQCGGGKNLEATYGRAQRILEEPRYRRFIRELPHPTHFAWPDETRTRLTQVGFTRIDVSLEDAPTVMPDRDSYRAFLEAVILRIPLKLIEDEALRAAFLNRMCEQAAKDEVPYSLDYVRLNISARLPA